MTLHSVPPKRCTACKWFSCLCRKVFESEMTLRSAPSKRCTACKWFACICRKVSELDEIEFSSCSNQALIPNLGLEEKKLSNHESENKSNSISIISDEEHSGDDIAKNMVDKFISDVGSHKENAEFATDNFDRLKETAGEDIANNILTDILSNVVLHKENTDLMSNILSEILSYVEGDDGKVNDCPDSIEFLMKYAKQRCSNCFISHMPLNRRCLERRKKMEAVYIDPEPNKVTVENDDVTLKMHQLDGLSDELDEIFNPCVPPSLGTVDCDDMTLFHTVNLFRGFYDIWHHYDTHSLCDHKRNKSSKTSCCMFCMIRSFSIRVNEVKIKGGRKIIKPMEIFSELPNVLPNSESSIEATFIFLLIKMLQDVTQFPAEMLVEKPKCGTSLKISSIIDCDSMEIPSCSGLEETVKFCLRTKVDCNCSEDCLISDLSNINILVFKFTDCRQMIMENQVNIYGHQFLYVCHLEKKDLQYRSNFIWDSNMYGVEDDKTLTASTIISNNVQFVVLTKLDKSSKSSLSPFKYDSKALNQFSRRAQLFLDPSKAEKAKQKQIEYDAVRDKTDKRKEYHKGIDAVRNKTEERKEYNKGIDAVRNKTDERKEYKKGFDAVRDKTDERKEYHKGIDAVRDKTDERKEYKRNFEAVRNCMEDRKRMRRNSAQEIKSKKLLENYDIDTGFNIKCCCCLQYKGIDMGHSIEKLNEEEHSLYLLLSDFSISKDQKYYVCVYCYRKIRQGKMKPTSQKELFLVPNIPDTLRHQLLESCQFKDTIFSDVNRFGDNILAQRYIFPNRLEQFLLKLILPFIRIANCRRGRYFTVMYFPVCS